MNNPNAHLPKPHVLTRIQSLCKSAQCGAWRVLHTTKCLLNGAVTCYSKCYLRSTLCVGDRTRLRNRTTAQTQTLAAIEPVTLDSVDKMNHMKDFLFAIFILTLFSCNPKSKNENANDSSAPTNFNLTADERQYLSKMSYHRGQIVKLQFDTSVNRNFDSIGKIERHARLLLENELKKILKTSNFSDKGEINIGSLYASGIELEMNDGLSFRKDSMTRIFYTTKNLFFNHLKTKEKEIPRDEWKPDFLANIFNRAFQDDAHIDNFTFVKLPSSKNIQIYGMVARVSQGDYSSPPQNIYVFVSRDNFVYMAEIELKEPIKQILKCKAVWDSVHTISEKNLEAYRASNLKDTTLFNKGIELDKVAFNKYCDCYSREIKNEGLIVAVLKQMESIATYLRDPEQ